MSTSSLPIQPNFVQTLASKAALNIYKEDHLPTKAAKLVAAPVTNLAAAAFALTATAVSFLALVPTMIVNLALRMVGVKAFQDKVFTPVKNFMVGSGKATGTAALNMFRNIGRLRTQELAPVDPKLNAPKNIGQRAWARIVNAKDWVADSKPGQLVGNAYNWVATSKPGQLVGKIASPIKNGVSKVASAANNHRVVAGAAVATLAVASYFFGRPALNLSLSAANAGWGYTKTAGSYGAGIAGKCFNYIPGSSTVFNVAGKTKDAVTSRLPTWLGGIAAATLIKETAKAV